MTTETAQGPRRAYSTPTLIDYGAVAKLTQGANSTGTDAGIAGMMNGVCL